VPHPAQAFARAIELASPEHVIFITVSVYLVGDLRKEWMSRELRWSGGKRRLITMAQTARQGITKNAVRVHYAREGSVA